MEVKMETGPASQIDADMLVVGIFQDEKIDQVLKELDKRIPQDFIKGFSAECVRENFTGKIGQSLQLPTYGAIGCLRLAIAGLGKKNEVSASTIRKVMGSIARKVSGHSNLESVAFAPRAEDKSGSLKEGIVQAITEAWILGSYTFTKYKTKKKDTKPEAKKLETLLVVTKSTSKAFNSEVKRGKVIADATNFARDLVAEPPANMTPTKLAEAAQGLKGKSLSCEVLESNEVKKLGMGAFLGVARGAKEPAKFIIIRYSHPDATKTVAIAGKGITFDSGGLSIKPAQGMEHMKYDMTGAAVAIGTMKAIAELKPQINVIVVAPATENMPGGAALHPGDVLRAMNGKTIEVNNTDAEGRLILADALSYLVKEKPDEIIDIATLTGAVVTALGRTAAGIMGNNQGLIERLINSGAEAGEKFWQLPLFDEYKDTLKSDIADLKNAGARGEAPSSSAGMFLQEFVSNCTWAHLDIAGPAWVDKDKDELSKGGTAFGLRTLCYYLISQAAT